MMRIQPVSSALCDELRVKFALVLSRVFAGSISDNGRVVEACVHWLQTAPYSPRRGVYSMHLTAVFAHAGQNDSHEAASQEIINFKGWMHDV